MLGQTDGRTPYRFIDPAPHTMRAVPITTASLPPTVFEYSFTVRVLFEINFGLSSNTHASVA